MHDMDFGRHSQDYADHRPGFPESFYRRLDALAPIAGADALDLATGPGTVAIELASRGASVVGVDLSLRQVAVAAAAARGRGQRPRTRFLVARAEATGLASGRFDLVTAGHCWHWLDGAATFEEARRVLRPGGSLVIAHYSYLAEHAPVARDTEKLILELNPSWAMAGWTGVFPELIDDVVRGGFELVEQFCYQHDEEFTHESWRGRMRTCNGVGSGGLPANEVRRFDQALARMLQSKYPEPVTIAHRVWCVVARNSPLNGR